MSIPPIVTLGPVQVPHNIGILSRKGERMPWGAAQKGANCHDEMAKGISKMRDKTLAPLPIFLAIPLCYLTISPNDRMEPRNGRLYTLTRQTS
jgi:hypothetical protein